MRPPGGSLDGELDAPESDEVLVSAMGEAIHGSYLEVKRSEWAQSVDEDGEWETAYLGRGF